MKRSLLLLISSVVLPAAAVFSQPSQPSPATQSEAEVARGSNAFAVELYGELRQQGGNLFFSPASISTAFGMAYAGAGGSTAAEMKKAFHFTLPPDQLHAAIGAFVGNLNATHVGYRLRMANALWAQENLRFLPGYLALTKADYAAGFHRVDFGQAPENARQTINQWVEQQTEHKIQNLLQPGTVTPDTRLILTNAIYFKADWKTRFKEAQTKEEDFHLTPTQTVRARLMHLEDSLRYFNGGTFQVLEIPYADEEMSMIVFLPNDPGGLSAFEQSLTASSLQKSFDGLQFNSKVILTLPKFEATKEFELRSALGALGIKQAFDARTADFSAMTGEHNLRISAVIHKAYIDVSEEGTVAAAATGITMTLAMARPQEPLKPVIFRADHPFLYLIRDNRSQAILFMGRVVDPTK